jgi:hypothetical protein
MRVVVLDFETEFSDSYTLSKMTTESYIRDPRFKAHGAAIKWSKDHAAIWYDEPRLRQVLKNEDWSDVFLISHHAHFDHLILSHHYSVVPRMSGCTLSMARLLLGNHISVSLDSVRKEFGLPPKSTPYSLFKGKHWHELTPHEQTLVAEGACDECESIWQIFGILAKDFPPEEYEVVHHTIRMFTQPVLRADVNLLATIWEKEDREKRTRLRDLNVNDADLQSADRFAALLRAEGVEPETKPGKNGPIWAFAKTDRFMEELLEDEDDRIRALAEARVGAKSTLLQTRAETFGYMASRGALTVYLRMYGAHTTRWSGGDGCLTSDTQILVFDYQKGLTKKRIVDILKDDLVWDGEDFVEHDGVAFQGFKKVIEHDGIRGTEDHIVFDVSGKKISLATAVKSGTRIMDCREPSSREVETAWKGKAK